MKTRIVVTEEKDGMCIVAAQYRKFLFWRDIWRTRVASYEVQPDFSGIAILKAKKQIDLFLEYYNKKLNIYFIEYPKTCQKGRSM
jgi:hypothetical protein